MGDACQLLAHIFCTVVKSIESDNAMEMFQIDIRSLISGVLLGIFALSSLAFFIMLLLGGVNYIESGKDRGKTEAARGQITAGLIGLVIIFAFWAILQLT